MSHYDGRTNDASDEIRASRMHGMSWRKCFGLHSARNSAKFTRIQRDQGKSARAAGQRRLQESRESSRTRFRAMAERIRGIHQVRQSWRLARRGGDLWGGELSCGGGARSFHEHDDALRISMGGGALQQRRLSRKEPALW